MKETQLKETLMEDARRGGICAEGYGLMRGYDRDGLIGYYVANPDWCMERDFPSLELLRSEFSDIENKGVFVGKTFDGEVFDKLQTYIFHDCKGTIKVAMDYENAVIPMLYFANGCRMRVECEQKNDPPITVPLYVVDDCPLTGSTMGKCGARKPQYVTFARRGGCKFKRHTIKLIER